MTEQRPSRRPVRRRTEDDSRQRAEALHNDGMPFQMAMAVAHGRMDLSEALERMARKERAEKLAEEHGLSHALAVQIAMGHVDLEVILRRRRLEAHREAHRERTVLTPGTRWTFGLHGKRVAAGTVRETRAYSFDLEPDKGEIEEIHKLQVKYAYAPGDWKRAKKAIKTDKALSKAPLEPIRRPQDRYGCSDKRLFSYLDRGTEVSVTTLEGDVIRGRVMWFSRYEIGLQVRGDVEIVVFRHAFHALTS